MPASVSPPIVADNSWKVFGALALMVLLVLMAVYCGWRASSTRVEILETNTSVTPTSTPISQPSAQPPPLPFATHPLRWQDLTLMLRAGYDDNEIIAATRDKELVSVIGPSEAAALRDLGAGGKLLNNLRTRPLYAAPLIVPRVIVTAPVPVSTGNAPTVAPVDYATRDEQVKNLQRQIDALDEKIRRARAHPNPYRLPNGAFNDEGYAQGDESSLKKYLDRLDQQRSDLRRQKWRLEGR